MATIGMPRRIVAPVLAILLVAMLGVLAAGAAIAQRFEGVASCAGSTCHGRAEGSGAADKQQ